MLVEPRSSQYSCPRLPGKVLRMNFFKHFFSFAHWLLMFFLSGGVMVGGKKITQSALTLLPIPPWVVGWTLQCHQHKRCGNFSFPVPLSPCRAGPFRTRSIKRIALWPRRKSGGAQLHLQKAAPSSHYSQFYGLLSILLEGRCPPVHTSRQRQKVVQLVQYYLKYIPPGFVVWVCWNSTVLPPPLTSWLVLAYSCNFSS